MKVVIVILLMMFQLSRIEYFVLQILEKSMVSEPMFLGYISCNTRKFFLKLYFYASIDSFMNKSKSESHGNQNVVLKCEQPVNFFGEDNFYNFYTEEIPCFAYFPL